MTQQENKHAQARTRRAAVAGGALVLAAGAYGIVQLFSMQEREVTEDAYVEGNMVQVTTQVAGTVAAITADNTDRVAAGQEVARLGAVDAQLALERSEALLARTVRQVRAQFASSSQMRANADLRRAELNKVEADFKRRAGLGESGAISGEDLEHAREAVLSARAGLASAEQQFLANQAYVDGTSVATHPDVLAAAVQVKDALVACGRTSVPAPVAGMVARRNLWTDFVPALACYGIFVMLVLATTAVHTFREVQHDDTVFSHAQQVKNMLAQFGSSFGIAVATAALQGRGAAHYTALNARFSAGDPAYEQALHAVTGSLAQQGAANPAAMAAASLAQALGQQATLLAALDYFAVVACIGLAGAVLMLAQRVLK